MPTIDRGSILLMRQQPVFSGLLFLNKIIKKHLHLSIKSGSIANAARHHAPLAQLDRVFDYESKGRGFESPRARQSPELTLRDGALAQLVARDIRIVEVSGSNPLCSTTESPVMKMTRAFLFARLKAHDIRLADPGDIWSRS